MKIIMVVAFDLSRNYNKQPEVGKETGIACERAYELSMEDANSIIAATAGHAPSKWDSAWMAKLMETYLRSKEVTPERLLIGKAEAFNTAGEMKCLAKLISQRSDASQCEVVLAVKWWHAPRAKFLCRYWLRQYNLSIPITVSKCPSYASWRVVACEFLGAWPKNILRILLNRIRNLWI